jgi:hypothetical protein
MDRNARPATSRLDSPERHAGSERSGLAAPERSAEWARRRDLVGTPLFWLTIAITVCAAVPFAIFPVMRAWLGTATLMMWTCFFTANAVRSRRTHSVISAPVYLIAAAFVAGNALGFVEVHIWMVWVIGAGVIAANLSERVFGKYL